MPTLKALNDAKLLHVEICLFFMKVWSNLLSFFLLAYLFES